MALNCGHLAKLFFFMVPIIAFGDWGEETLVFQSSWGSGYANFGIEYGDVSAFDLEPRGYSISESGGFAVDDYINKRYWIVSDNGEFLSEVASPDSSDYGWAVPPVFVGDNIFSIYSGKLYFISQDGSVINVQSPSVEKLSKEGIYSNGGYLYLQDSGPSEMWYQYDPVGQMIKSYTSRPEILGRVSEEVFLYDKQKAYRTIVDFGNDNWTIANRLLGCEFQRDNSGHLYCISDKKITRYNSCGKPMVELVLPEDEVTVVPSGIPGVEDEWIINSSYMNPKMDIHGNVYATRRTPENYSLVKWMWQDLENDKDEGPDAPINLTTEHGNVVQLSWEKSLQDPGCVTGYRILRSEAPNELGIEILTLEKGADSAFDNTAEAGKTYYYRVQALSEVGDSEPSSASSVEIPVQ